MNFPEPTEEERRAIRESRDRQRRRNEWLLPILAGHDDVATVLTGAGIFGEGLLVVMRDGSAFDVSIHDRAAQAYGLDITP